MQLTWFFEWDVGRGTARPGHGTYTIERTDDGEWIARFVRADTEEFRKTKRSVSAHYKTFQTPADAIRACQRHAERYSAESSDRFTISTPLPE